MSDDTKIEWCDATWNAVTGCEKVSPGCDHCYAETFAERWRGVPGHHFEQGFDVTLRPDRLDQPLKWTRPRKVFVNSMSDLFHKDVPDDYIGRVFAVMALAPQHTFQLLTKRHARMKSLLSDPAFEGFVCGTAIAIASGYRDRPPAGNPMNLGRWPLPNVWAGVSVEDQHWADIRVPALCETPAAVRFLSCEPLLGEVMLHALYEHVAWSNTEYGTLCMCGAAMASDGVRCHGGNRISWVIAGGESGPGARPCEMEWLRSLRDQCAETGTAFFCKQVGSVLGRELKAGPKGNGMYAWPEDLRIREFPRSAEAVPRG